MKYKVGDLLLIKDCEYKSRHDRPNRYRYHPDPTLFNSYGVVTKAYKHTEIWEGETTKDKFCPTEDNNMYCWFSQVDGTEYSFYENEVTGEVIE